MSNDIDARAASQVPLQPNVILFVADQLRADHLGCYGHPLGVTPNIDRIATAGVRFAEAHAASALCMPNRATMITGRMPSLHGVRRNGIPLPHRQHTAPGVLAESGYRTALIGKAHFQPFGVFAADDRPGPDPDDAVILPGALDDYGMELVQRWRDDPGHRIRTPYYGFDDVEVCLYHGDIVEGDYARWLEERSPETLHRRGADHALDAGGVTARDAWRTAVPEELYPSAFVADRTVAWLERHTDERPEQPFFMMSSFPDPHHPFTPPGRFWDLVDPADVTLPQTFTNRSTSPFIDWIHRISAGGPLGISHIPFAPGEREAREIMALTLGSIANIDHQIGTVLDAVARLGLADETVVMFTSDHGDLMGDHGAFLKGPMHFDGLTRVPLLWHDPRRPQAPEVRRGAVSSLDLARTLYGLAGARVPIGTQGVDLTMASDEVDRAVLVENESAQLLFDRPAPFALRTLRTARWRLTMSNDPGLCELYDLDGDPGELHNLWSSADHVDARTELTDRLVATMIEHADQGITPWCGG